MKGSYVRLLWPLYSCIKWASTWNNSLHGHKELSHLCCAYCHVWAYHFLFWIDVYCFVLFEVYVSYSTWPTPPIYLFSVGGKGFLCLRASYSAIFLQSYKIKPIGQGNQFSLLSLILLEPIYVFHPVPVWVMSVLVALTLANHAVGYYPGAAALYGRQQVTLAQHI